MTLSIDNIGKVFYAVALNDLFTYVCGTFLNEFKIYMTTEQVLFL